MPRKGWTKLPGSSERYVSPEGQVVSRRQYDNKRAQAAGYRNRSEFEARYEDPSYRWAIERIQLQKFGAINEANRKRIDRIGTQESQMIHKAQETGWGRVDRSDRTPNGPMAQLLVAMGLRDPSATYAVGDTEGRKR